MLCALVHFMLVAFRILYKVDQNKQVVLAVELNWAEKGDNNPQWVAAWRTTHRGGGLGHHNRKDTPKRQDAPRGGCVSARKLRLDTFHHSVESQAWHCRQRLKRGRLSDTLPPSFLRPGVATFRVLVSNCRTCFVYKYEKRANGPHKPTQSRTGSGHITPTMNI